VARRRLSVSWLDLDIDSRLARSGRVASRGVVARRRSTIPRRRSTVGSRGTVARSTVGSRSTVARSRGRVHTVWLRGTVGSRVSRRDSDSHMCRGVPMAVLLRELSLPLHRFPLLLGQMSVHVVSMTIRGAVAAAVAAAVAIAVSIAVSWHFLLSSPQKPTNKTTKITIASDSVPLGMRKIFAEV
jgi:hypothetical protein